MNLLASLRYLVALDEHRHFGRAAQACHITQPALSNALRALEEEFGTSIVKRGRAFADFTPEGERILASAQRMLHEHELLQQELNSVAGRPQGTLTLAAVPTAVPIAARFAALLQARHPGIAPVVRSMSSPEIEVGLESLSVDMGLGYTDRVGQRGIKLRTIDQYTERYFLLRRAESPSADGLQMGPAMSWLEASQLPLSLLTAEMHNRTIIDSAFAVAGAEVRPAIQTNSILTLGLSVVAEGGVQCAARCAGGCDARLPRTRSAAAGPPRGADADRLHGRHHRSALAHGGGGLGHGGRGLLAGAGGGAQRPAGGLKTCASIHKLYRAMSGINLTC